ncbi:hypothetical protein F5J12DRAFT_789076 [Pisolithus orientalis]|uniref:uncharacterized protein n=1 Tax=Pisolithus orientalis TaxID=936130 RepID=UPI002225801D|nr:uncharacterized protein F5J12DRAFT_789076 [Pisolithus orientalis]KAI5980635.1 hypothetical protein F5J12DRAFT_789076 [Pisolithus orientalis]
MSTKQSCQVHFHHRANVRPIKPRQSSSHIKQSKNLEETLVQLWSNMDIVADSCDSLLDQFMQEREPTALAEGSIAAVVDPHDNLMNQFLNEQEPTAPPVDGMNDMKGTNASPTHFKLDEDNGANHLTFGMPKQSEMRDLFEEICNGELPSTQQSLQMEQWGLAPVPCCNQVLCTLHAMVSHYGRNTTPSNMPFDPTLDRHLVWAVNAIARELGTATRDQYGAASQGLQLINMLDLMEVIHYPHSTFENCPKPFITSQSHPSHQSVVEVGILYLACQIEVASVHLKQTADVVGWPVHWSANLATVLNQLNSLILVMVLCASYTPPLPACYHVYLRHQDDELIPLSAFCIINNISASIPHWTPHAADPNSSFAFPWWIYCSEEYAADSQRLQGKGLFSTAWDFFKLMMAQGLWPLPEVPIADCLNGHIEEQVNYCIENI